MSRRRTEPYRVDITIEQTRCLLDEKSLFALQQLLVQLAPSWSSGLHVYVDSRTRSSMIDMRDRGALFSAVRDRIHDKGDLYLKLGGQPDDIVGAVELRGRGNALILIVWVDDRGVFSRAGEWSFGNHVTFQLCCSRVERQSAARWARDMFEALAETFNPEYGFGHTQDEYDVKNTTMGGPVLRAIGRDISRYLPGLYWLNFFGKPYRDLIGRLKLLTTPAYEVKEVADGVLLSLASDPRDWNTSSYHEMEAAALRHIGQEYFFLKDEPDRPTLAPDLGLPDH